MKNKYLNENYKQSMEKLNENIKTNRDVRMKFSPHSAEYLKLLENELELLEDQRSLINSIPVD